MKLFKNKISTAVAMFLVVVGILIGTQIQNVLSDDNIYEQLEKFKDVLSLADKYYVDNVDTQKLVDAAINGLLGQLDPHSVYIPKKEVQQIAEDFRGSFEGIGI